MAYMGHEHHTSLFMTSYFAGGPKAYTGTIFSD